MPKALVGRLRELRFLQQMRPRRRCVPPLPAILPWLLALQGIKILRLPVQTSLWLMLMCACGRRIKIHLFGTKVQGRYAGAMQAKTGTKQKARIGTVRPRPSRLAKARMAYQERASSEDEKPWPEMTNGTPVFISQPGPLPRNTLADKYVLTTLTEDLGHL